MMVKQIENRFGYMSYNDVIERLNWISSVYGMEFKLESDMNIMHGAYLNNENAIKLGIQNLDYKQFGVHPKHESKPKSESEYEKVPYLNFATLIVTTFHELRHMNQNNVIFKQLSSNDEKQELMALDHLGNMCCPGYYADFVGTSYKGISYYNYKNNYRSMFHELDAERTALVDACNYFEQIIGMNKEDAEQLVLDVVNLKISRHTDIDSLDDNPDYYTGYFVDTLDGNFPSMSRVFKSFDNAFEIAKTRHRDFFKEMVQDQHSDLWKACKHDKRIIRSIAETCDGVTQAKMIASVMFQYDPELRKDYPILNKMDLSCESLFGYTPKIRQKDSKFKIFDMFSSRFNKSAGRKSAENTGPDF